jgi:hypothetical protein
MPLWVYIKVKGEDAPDGPAHHLMEVTLMRVTEHGIWLEGVGWEPRYFVWEVIEDVDVRSEPPAAVASAITSRSVLRAHKKAKERQNG